MGFWEKLAASIEKRDSLLCVGLDPHPGRIPERYESVSAFMRAVVAETSDYACVFKPNIAFYEALGPDGIDVLAEILAAIPVDIPVILDGKRNDITSTATAITSAGLRCNRRHSAATWSFVIANGCAASIVTLAPFDRDSRPPVWRPPLGQYHGHAGPVCETLRARYGEDCVSLGLVPD